MRRGTILNRLRWLAAAAVLAILAALVAGQVAARRARVAIAAATRADAQLRVTLLDSEIARFRLLPLALGDDRDVAAALARTGDDHRLDRKLEALARTSGAAVIYLVAADGRAIAASNWRTPSSFVGTDYRFRRYFTEARARGAASQFALGTVSRRPGLYLARRTAGGGVIVVKLEFDRVEAAWRRAGHDTYVRDARGVVLVTSRPAWRFAASRPLDAAALAALRRDASLSPAALAALPSAGGEAIEASVPAGQPGWTLVMRRAVGAPVAAARRGAAIGAALFVLTLAALGWGWRQRALLARRRTAELEEAVADRTAALTREIEERAASEVRAAELREGLRQANRLATLGQVTASVAHETAQPVAAIRAYAETSETLLDRGDEGAVRQNLAAIRRLSDRIGAVTAELRGFSRRRPGEVRALPLAEVIDGALLILKDQLRPIALECPPPPRGLMVMGGRVRLEQVLVNLIQNAIEALAATPDPRLAIETIAAEARVRVRVRDNGPGIAPEVAERLFTPFVTSRPSGLGLGLVIASDIMTELGGALRLVPATGGACFEMELARG